MARTAITAFASAVKVLPAEKLEEVGNYTLSKIKTTANNYDEADFVLRDAIFSVYLSWGQYSDAAQTLSGLNLESATRPYSDTEKADIYVKCAGEGLCSCQWLWPLVMFVLNCVV